VNGALFRAFLEIPRSLFFIFSAADTTGFP
jgi:hypothetical protein